MSTESDDDFFDDDLGGSEKEENVEKSERRDNESDNNSESGERKSCDDTNDEKDESVYEELEEEIYEEEFEDESQGNEENEGNSSRESKSSDKSEKDDGIDEDRGSEHGSHVETDEDDVKKDECDRDTVNYFEHDDKKDENEKKNESFDNNEGGSEELENLFNYSSQSNFSSSASSSPAKRSSRNRPKSAKNPMKVLITGTRPMLEEEEDSFCMSDDSRKAIIYKNPDNSLYLNEDQTNNYGNLRPRSSSNNRQSPHEVLQQGMDGTMAHGLPRGVQQGDQPPPLLVTKSPVHNRPISARRSRETSPRSGGILVRPASAGVIQHGQVHQDTIGEEESSESIESTERRTLVSRPGATAKRSRDSSRENSKSMDGDYGAEQPAVSGGNRGINRMLSNKEQMSQGPMLSTGKPRPKSAVGFTQPKIMNRGPSPSAKVLPRHRPLGDYSRSLQMLGVKVPGPPPKSSRTPRSSSSQSWQSEGKLHTRVTRRSTSLEDVTRAIPQVKDPQALKDLQVGVDEAQRATLSQAIYEEWYFKRCKQIRSKKIKAKQKIQEEQRNREELLREKEEKVGVAVAAWEETKIEQKKQKKEKIKEIEAKKEDEVKEKDEQQMRVTAALIAWETEKIELAKKKREQKKIEKEKLKEIELEKTEKKEEAEIIFLSWKEQKKIEEREKRRKKKEEELEIRLKQEEDLKEKQEIASLAFTAWKKKKAYEEAGTMRKVYLDAEMSEAVESRKRLHRSSEALHAYDNWLDEVEEKDLVRSFSNSRSAILQTNRPPWWPGGTRKSLMGSC